MLEAREIPRLLAGWHPDRALTLAEHNAIHGELAGAVLRRGPELVEEIEASGLRGRGGAGFPAAIKFRAVAGRRRTILLANGAEGEPASGKDACLLAYAPHLILDGVSAAAAAIKADMAIVAVKESLPDAVAALETAIAERTRVDRLQPVIVAVPADYVAGEESALVNFMNTGVAVPTFTPPRPFERGVRGRPTLIQNVETLAHVALIARHGGAWYRRLGADDDPGSMLVTIEGAVATPGVYEVECGTPLGWLMETAGGSRGPLQACLVGGYGGTWVDAERALQLPLSRVPIRSRPGVGPGVITALGANECGLRSTADIARYLADESAGQCGPCAFGLPAIAEALEDIAAGAAQPGTSRWVKWWAEQIQGRGACHHPDGAVRMVRSALRVFAEDLTCHETGEARPAALVSEAMLSR